MNSLLGRIMLLAPRLAKEHGLDSGFKTLINTGRGGGQEVFHIHVHVFGGGEPSRRTSFAANHFKGEIPWVALAFGIG